MIHLSQTNTNSFDELVFDHRNQAYGAYVLRREYPRHVLKSLLIGVAIIASIMAIPYLGDLFKKEKPNKQPVTGEYNFLPYIKPDDDKPEVKPKEKSEPPAENTLRNLIPVITVDVGDSLNTMDEMKDSYSGLYNHKGIGDFIDIGGEGDNPEEVTGLTKKVYPYFALEQKPEYVGGDEALWKFLRDNLVYPEHAKQIGLEGKVYVTFVIDEFGNVTKIDVPREIGGGLDEEAIRVMKMMPRWKPGKQAGYPVSVSYQLPIIFELD